MPPLTKSILLGGIIGFVWFVIQFLSAELIYRVALSETLPTHINDTLYDVSDVIAFPAGEIYDALDANITEKELERFTQNTSLDHEVQQSAESLLTRYQSPADFEALVDETYEFLSSHDIFPEVPVWAEYAIYAGTCLVWGICIGLAVGILTFSVLSKASHKSNPPALVNQDSVA